MFKMFLLLFIDGLIINSVITLFYILRFQERKIVINLAPRRRFIYQGINVPFGCPSL